MEKKSRKRGDNWTYEDKHLLVILMKEASKIIDSKYCDANTNKKKIEEWHKVQKSFCEISGTERSIQQLKGAWRRMKMTAKDDDSLKSKKIKNTEDDQKSRSPDGDSNDSEDTEVTQTYDTDNENNIHDEDYLHENRDEQDLPNEAVLVNDGTVEVVVDLIEGTANKKPPKRLKSIYSSEELDTENKKQETNKRGMTVQEQLWNRLRKRRKAPIYITKCNAKQSFLNRLIQHECVLKIRYQQLQMKHLEVMQQKELSHQELRHKLEIEILNLEKTKKELEIRELENR